MERRKFLKKTGLGTAALSTVSMFSSLKASNGEQDKTIKIPIVVCTWNLQKANQKAWEILKNGGDALDAVEQGVMVEEADVNNQSVGKGGRPDRNGNVTLDACIMNKEGNYGAVVCMQNIVHPVSVARRVMEKSPYVILAAKGAEEFAYSQGFKKENLLTEKSKQEWLKWRESANYDADTNVENHAIGMLAIDEKGDISGACTTSGMGYKVPGRVGDSPIIGSGLFIDNEVGGAASTGVGEEVLKTVGAFLVVELMRQGNTPQQACKEAVKRIVKKYKKYDFQIGFLALNKRGEVGAYAIHSGLTYNKYDNEGQSNNSASSYL